MALTAITRLPSATLPQCELSFLDREPIDVALATEQHAAYRAALADAGATVVTLPALDALPDAVFVEDTALIFDECAVLAPMGAPSRRPESAPMAETLRAYRPVHILTAPATLDGGDVLRMGRTIYVGQTPRTNRAALDQLTALIGPLGYTVVGVPVTRCLHFKTACAAAAPDRVLINPAWVAPEVFRGYDVLTIDPAEPWAANVLAIGPSVLIPASAPRTCGRLRAAGLDPVPVDVSELQKAEAGVTCLSLIIRA
ncbi:MAG TPA: arginine deiminase-related protein [Gemmatimonadaceae bacterium]|jgi:dimethylargininase|nr:arginine deiminase-related protein [Gemmatimonadaceae bacterium]